MISEFSFGRIVVQGQVCTNDIKIVGGNLVPDWWRQRGHAVEIADVQDILDSKPDIVVIGKGQPGFMRTTDSLRKHLDKNNIKLIEEPTRDAIQTFNRLSEKGTPVAGGFHVSC